MNEGRGFHKDFALRIGSIIMKRYWGPMWKLLEQKPVLKDTIPAFLVNPTTLIYYVGKTHLGLEYEGPMAKEELDKDLVTEALVFDYRTTDNLLDEILGINYHDSTVKGIKFPLPPVSRDIYLPTNPISVSG